MIFKQLTKLPESTIILSANNRIKRTILETHRNNQKKQTSPAPQVFTLDEWIKNQYQQTLQKKHTLLSLHQAQTLWEEQNETSATTHDAYQAWVAIHEWQIPIKQIKQFEHSYPEAERWLLWQQRYQEKLAENNWLDPSQAKMKWISAPIKIINPPKNIITVGLNECTPLEQKLLTTLATNIHITPFTTQTPKDSTTLLSHPSAQDEWENMAKWAIKHATEQPNHQIACVVPSLNQNYRSIQKYFNQANNQTKIAINFAVAKPFTHYPVIENALMMLNPQHKKSIPIEQLSKWLQSTRSVITPLSQRLKLEQTLRQQEQNQLPWRYILKTMKKDCPTLYTQITNMNQVKKAIEKKTSLYNWHQHLCQQLQALEWPGLVNDEEQNCCSAWLKNSQEYFQKINLVTGKTDINTAFNKLQQWSEQTQHHPPSKNSNIHVLGVLEVCDIPFDKVWLSGMGETQWPSSAKPNPFLPQTIQNQYNIPHANQSRELAFCRQLTKKTT